MYAGNETDFIRDFRDESSIMKRYIGTIAGKTNSLTEAKVDIMAFRFV